MFRCDKCGKIFEWPVMIKECVGEYWGIPAYDEFPYSPCCHKDFTELEDEEEEEYESSGADSDEA